MGTGRGRGAGATRVAAVGLLSVAAALAVLPAVSPGASKQGGTSRVGTQHVTIVQPAQGQLVRSSQVRIVLRTRSGDRPRKADVDGVDITRRLKRTPKGAWAVTLRRGHGVHIGHNNLAVSANAKATTGTFDHARFTLATPDRSLVDIKRIRTGGDEAPVRVVIGAARESEVRLYVNGRRFTGRLTQEGKSHVALLGAHDGLRHGKNSVKVLAHRTHRLRHHSRADADQQTFRLSHGRPLASAGKDRAATVGSHREFDAGDSVKPPGSVRRSFSWEIVAAPPGSKAKLHHSKARRPSLVPDVPGYYKLRVSVRGHGKSARSGLAAGSGVAAADSDSPTTGPSSDQLQLTAPPDVPTFGIRLQTALEVEGMVLGGKVIQPNRPGFNYAILDRATLELGEHGNTENTDNPQNVTDLQALVDRNKGKMLVLKWQSGRGIPAGFKSLLQQVGIPEKDIPPNYRYGSLVGVIGAEGSAVYNIERINFFGQRDHYGMDGYLRRNSHTGLFDFVFTDAKPFHSNEDAGSTDSTSVRVSNTGYRTAIKPGQSGFHVVVLDAVSLLKRSEDTLVLSGPDANPAAAQNRLLKYAQDSSSTELGGRQELVFIQSFGTPQSLFGADPRWDQIAAELQDKLGANRQLFNAMNTPLPNTLNDEKTQGGYALVARYGQKAPTAEASTIVTGKPAAVQGMLMRGRDSRYEPTMSAPSPEKFESGKAPFNYELEEILSAPPDPFHPFLTPDGSAVPEAAARAVMKFLGTNVMKFCSERAPDCDIRELYADSFYSDWGTARTRLDSAQCNDTKEYTKAQCAVVLEQLKTEISDGNAVRTYFQKLQSPFGSASVAALADVTQITTDIKTVIKPPEKSHTTATALEITAIVLEAVALVTGNPEATPAIKTLNHIAEAGAIGLGAAGYALDRNGHPVTIGEQLDTDASNLGVDLAASYRAMGDSLDDTARLIVSDYGKLTAVAKRIDAKPGPGEIDWRITDPNLARDLLIKTTQTQIYRKLLPIVYTAYVVGTRRKLNNARDWVCEGYTAYNKRLFDADPDPDHKYEGQVDDAQFFTRVNPQVSANPSLPLLPFRDTQLIAVAEQHAVGSLRHARIKGIPGSITTKLFAPLTSGGLGLHKLDLFSPATGFRYRPKYLGQMEYERDDRTKNWGTLDNFPYSPTREWDDRIICQDLPDPPGNSE